MKSFILAAAFIAFLGSSCTHSVHMVHAGDYEKSKTSLNEQKLIEARAEQKVIMGFVFENQHPDEAKAKLESQCLGGTVHGVTTQLSTDHSFFSWTNVVLMKGYCLKG